MSALQDELLTLVLLYGYPVIFGVVLVAGLGMPLPVEPVLLAAGAFAATGDLSLALLVVLVAAAATIGDCIGYGLGRWLGYAALERHGARVGISASRLGSARGFLRRWTGVGVFITRWLLTPLGVPVNLLAGATSFPAATFFAYDAAGELLFATIFLGLGYYVGDNWTVLLQGVESVPLALALLTVGIVLLAVGVWLLLRGRRHPRPRAASGAIAEGR